MKLNDIRKLYTGFFVSKGHKLVKSSSLIPDNDPTLLFTNAGMVQFKDVFTGKEKRDYTRATTAQKCLRAGGKHNDLDNVGYTNRHHTFFEMLGNFSFGDYFKEQAISYAWEFISKELKLPKDKLYFTVYPEDTEARELWKKIANVDDNRVIGITDNLWSMGDVGPCGFDTEIFYDKGEHVKGGLPGSPDEDGDRYIEIWNNVFMQYETLPDGRKIELKNKNIDTGMGLERIASVMQGVDDNFDIDLFKNLINYIEDTLAIKKTDSNVVSFKVIADHIRACSFLIAEGLLPSNEGRGYVLRRIMRRALRHINMLGIKQPVFYKIFDNVKDQMGDVYPELIEAEKLIKDTIKTEEENFGQTLDAGLKILEDEVSKISGNVLSGESAFKLYDTYGFPLDLTADILRSRNISVDVDGFNKAMQKQRLKSKQHSNFKGEAGQQKIWYDVKEKVGYTNFVGYDELTSSSVIKSIVKNGEMVNEATPETEQDNIFIIVDKTPFYAECGGQISDIGTAEINKKSYKISDVKKNVGDVYFHKIHLSVGDKISVGDSVVLKVDTDYRHKVMANHSATHLLQKALQEVIGKSVMQKGSWVGSDALRFDFSNPKALTQEQIFQVEKLVNKYISEHLDITKKEMPIDEAKASGAMALFGEKYGDIVRVVNMGGVSIELCGGTHCNNTSEIGFFKILKEESIASGIRRIEAITSDKAFDLAKQYGLDINKSPDVLIGELQNKISEEKLKEQDKLAQEFEEKRKLEIENQNKQIDYVVKSVKKEKIKDIDFVYGVFDNVSPKNLKPSVDKLKSKSNMLLTLISTENKKVSVIIAVSENLTDTISAVDVVKKASVLLGGNGGGGRPDLAQAGGVDMSKTDDVIKMCKDILQNI